MYVCSGWVATHTQGDSVRSSEKAETLHRHCVRLEGQYLVGTFWVVIINILLTKAASWSSTLCGGSSVEIMSHQLFPYFPM